MSNHMMPMWQPFVVPQPTAIEEILNGVAHPVKKETITEYQKLVDEPLLHKGLTKAMCKELLGRLAQGYNEVKGTDIIHFMSL